MSDARPPGSRLPRLVQSLLFLRDPIGTMERARRRHGPVFRIDFVGFPGVVYAATAELAEQIYAVDDGGGRAGPTRGMLEPAVGTNSILTLDGPRWRRHRKLVSPPLHGRAIAGYRDQIAEIAAESIERWPVGVPFRLRDRTQEITLEVILRLVLGVTDERRLDRLRGLLPEIADIDPLTIFVAMAPWMPARKARSTFLRRLPVLGLGRMLDVQKAIDELVYAQIAERRAAPDPEATDVLSLLVAARDADGSGLEDAEIRDELMAMLLAGHETTATALAWAFERLLRNEPVLARLRAEVDGGEEETYLNAVVKETLRSRPVLPGAPRVLDEPLDLGPYRIPAGWQADPTIHLVHHDPEVYPRPEEFRPERFLGDGAAAANRSWMPFGGGRRYCVGAQLALLEMRVVITEILRRVDLEHTDPAPEKSRRKTITIVPARSARVRVRGRRPSARLPEPVAGP